MTVLFLICIFHLLQDDYTHILSFTVINIFNYNVYKIYVQIDQYYKYQTDPQTIPKTPQFGTPLGPPPSLLELGRPSAADHVLRERTTGDRRHSVRDRR